MAVATGTYHALALMKSGEVYGWGSNENGQLGGWDIHNKTRPQLIVDIPDKVVGLAAGAYHSLALTARNKVYGFGRNIEGQLGVGTAQEIKRPRLIKGIHDKVVSLAAGDYHSLALTEGGDIYSWGENVHGQLGDGSTNHSEFPQLIKGIPGKVIGITAGSHHSLAVLENGMVFGFGENTFGQLGDETKTDKTHPQLIESIPAKVVGIAAGAIHTVALLQSGKVYGCGYNENGQLGVRITKGDGPHLNEALPGKVISIAAGNYHTLALLDNGTVYGCGSNENGQLGSDNFSKEITHDFIPIIISKMEKSTILCPFGKGGKAVGYTELERKFRELLGQEISL